MKKQTRILALLLTLFLLAFTAACAASTGGSDDHDSGVTDHEHEDAADHEHEDGAEHAEDMPVPNNGALIEIISPADGATFSSSDNIVVEIAVTNFALGEDGNHWHVAVDDATYGMITGVAHDTVLRGLEPGEHTISVVLANGKHQNLEGGDAITIEIK